MTRRKNAWTYKLNSAWIRNEKSFVDFEKLKFHMQKQTNSC